MALVFQEGQALGQGIQQAGTALGQALQQRGQQQHETALKQALAQNKYQQDLQLYKEKEVFKADLANDYLNNIVGVPKVSDQPPATGQLAGSTDQAPDTQQPSPIAQIGALTASPKKDVDLKLSSKELSKLTDDQITAMAMSPYPQHQKAADQALKIREKDQRKFEADRTYHTKQEAEVEKYLSGIRHSMRGKESSLQLSRNAIETGETGPLSWANMSQRLGIPEIMSQSGTQLSQAGKEFFFGNMMKVSARAQNQWLEERITKLAAEIGDPEINALTKNIMLEHELNLDKTLLNAMDELKAEDMKAHGFVHYNDLEERAFKRTEGQAEKIMDEVSFKTRELYEKDKGVDFLTDNMNKKVPKGTMLTPLMRNIYGIKYRTKDGKPDYVKMGETIKKLGYKIPSQEDEKRWQ